MIECVSNSHIKLDTVKAGIPMGSYFILISPLHPLCCFTVLPLKTSELTSNTSRVLTQFSCQPELWYLTLIRANSKKSSNSFWREKVWRYFCDSEHYSSKKRASSIFNQPTTAKWKSWIHLHVWYHVGQLLTCWWTAEDGHQQVYRPNDPLHNQEHTDCRSHLFPPTQSSQTHRDKQIRKHVLNLRKHFHSNTRNLKCIQLNAKETKYHYKLDRNSDWINKQNQMTVDLIKEFGGLLTGSRGAASWLQSRFIRHKSSPMFHFHSGIIMSRVPCS